MGVISFLSDFFSCREDHIPQETTTTIIDSWRNFDWTETLQLYRRPRKYKGFHWRRPI